MTPTAEQHLDERIDAAIKRIAVGLAPMRIPPHDSDPDLVLADCRAELTRLRTAYNELRDAVWNVPGEPATPSEEAHERTVAQAVDQSAAFHEVTSEGGMRDQLARIRAENERLREALKPFAEAAETIYMGDHGEEAYADPDDCRRAAAALAEKEKP